jgi:hypothetical protein
MKNKNIWLLPTDKPSRLLYFGTSKELALQVNPVTFRTFEKSPQNICITNDEKPKDGDWVIQKNTNKVVFLAFARQESYNKNKDSRELFTKIILTTDQDLIKEGVQAIDDEFLEWFVKNPSCEEVEIDIKSTLDKVDGHYHDLWEIIIPKEEPKQLFTDHPITELGDKEFVEAPIRECELISYDDNKYCYVKVEGIEKEIKRCYIYPQKGRCGKVDCVSIEEIKELLKKEPKQETLEEVADRLNFLGRELYALKLGAKWQQEQDKNKYSALETAISLLKQTTEFEVLDSWKQKIRELEQFKKK